MKPPIITREQTLRAIAAEAKAHMGPHVTKNGRNVLQRIYDLAKEKEASDD